MDDIEKQILEVIHNVNWLMKPHNSYVELVEIKGKKVVIHCVGSCAKCKTDCIGVTFKESMANIELFRI